MPPSAGGADESSHAVPRASPALGGKRTQPGGRGGAGRPAPAVSRHPDGEEAGYGVKRVCSLVTPGRP
jgi:hypothetical protein